MGLFDQLENKQALLNAIVMSSTDAIISKSLDGIITSWNPAAERMFGYSQKEAVGKHISLIIPEDRLSEENFIIGQIRSGKKVNHFETIRKTKNGRLFPISVTVSPVTDKNGRIIGASKIARDISERETVQKEKAELLERLKLLNGRKDEFIALASHELRTPLTSMDAYLQILLRLVNEEKTKTILEKALLQSKKINHIISDLLDISKIEAGKLILHYAEFDICRLLEDTVELISRTNEDFKITINSKVDSLMVTADQYKIDQVIVNLLTNAIRYSKEIKQIDILLKTDDRFVYVGVKDWGVGIHTDQFKNIFSRFYRVKNSDNTPGLGLGLYLCEQIITQHKGDIWVESEIGRGSTFWVKLPINK